MFRTNARFAFDAALNLALVDGLRGGQVTAAHVEAYVGRCEDRYDRFVDLTGMERDFPAAYEAYASQVNAILIERGA